MARYVDTALRPGEKILYDAKVHWAIFIAPFVRVVAVGFFLSLAWWGALFSKSTQSVALQFSGNMLIASALHVGIFTLIVLFIGLGGFIHALIYYYNSDFVITDRRVIAKFGLLSRTTSEQRLSKIESIHVYQSFLGRLLNYGRVTVTGTGSSATRFGPMADPIACKHALEEQLDATRADAPSND